MLHFYQYLAPLGQKIRVDSYFLWVSLIFGCTFVFLIPPFQSPDEPNHFLRAYQVSEGVFFPEKQDRRLGGDLPASLAQVRDSFSYLKMNYEARLDKGLIFRCLNIPLNAGHRSFTDFPNTAIYAPTAYLPQVAAIVLLCPLGATPLQMLYATRLANLFVWVLLVLAAIRLMPFLKNMLAALALLPASLVIAASANADVATNGLCWWLIAGFCAGTLPGFKNLIALAVVCANKLIALPLVFLYWLHPTPDPSPETSGRGDVERTVSASQTTLPEVTGEGSGVGWTRGHALHFALLLVVAVAATLIWGGFAQKQFIPYGAYNPAFRNAQTLNEGVDPAQQQAFMLENPLFFTKTAFVSAIKSLPATAAHFVGKFGWEKNYLHPAWLAILWLALAMILASSKNPLSGRQRLLAAGVVVLFAGMFAATMYALWCPVGAGELTNFQGRYFVPIAPVVALVLAGRWLQRFEKQIWLGTVIVLTMSNLVIIFSILGRYYG